MGVGVKHLYQLDAQTINNRFHCQHGEGVAYGILGSATRGMPGGGFLYTNRDTLSVGVVLHIGHLANSGNLPSEILDDMVANPEIAPLVEGGELVEYGAHMVCEGGLRNLPDSLYGDGWMIVGDAAGFASNNGFNIRGMDMAAQSGLLAAETILEVRKTGDYRSENLASYKRRVEDSFVYKDMLTYQKAPAVIGQSELYGAVPRFACDLFGELYSQGSIPKINLLPVARNALRSSNLGLMRLASLGIKAVRSL
jgi:electron transfer flavoprotein-quinone oxidoreductase